MAPGHPPPDFPRQDSILPSDLPQFHVAIQAPDLSPFLSGNTGIPGFTTLNSGLPGPHAMIVALIHGNEIAGAIVLNDLLRHPFFPLRGRLTLGFANIAAYRRFDPASPLSARCVEEDMNRVWDDAQLFGVRRSLELNRAREIRPLIDSADLLLDLHSMLWPSDPLLLCGRTQQGRALAQNLATPASVIADGGHAGGKRLIDYGRFTEATAPAAAVLVEAGQHWEHDTVAQTRATVAAFLRHAGMVRGIPHRAPAPGTFAEVTCTITARTHRFVFTRPFRGGEIIGPAGTLIAHDGDAEIRTPFENCLLVMPSLRASLGHTAVRLARLA